MAFVHANLFMERFYIYNMDILGIHQIMFEMINLKI